MTLTDREITMLVASLALSWGLGLLTKSLRKASWAVIKYVAMSFVHVGSGIGMAPVRVVKWMFKRKPKQDKPRSGYADRLLDQNKEVARQYLNLKPGEDRTVTWPDADVTVGPSPCIGDPGADPKEWAREHPTSRAWGEKPPLTRLEKQELCKRNIYRELSAMGISIDSIKFYLHGADSRVEIITRDHEWVECPAILRFYDALHRAGLKKVSIHWINKHLEALGTLPGDRGEFPQNEPSCRVALREKISLGLKQLGLRAESIEFQSEQKTFGERVGITATILHGEDRPKVLDIWTSLFRSGLIGVSSVEWCGDCCQVYATPVDPEL